MYFLLEWILPTFTPKCVQCDQQACAIETELYCMSYKYSSHVTNIPVILPHIWVSAVSTVYAWHASHVKLRTCNFEDLRILKIMWQCLIHCLTNCLIFSTVWSDLNICNDLGVTRILIFRSSVYIILTYILHYF